VINGRATVESKRRFFLNTCGDCHSRGKKDEYTKIDMIRQGFFTRGGWTFQKNVEPR
tara:strand:+ start:2517 stop:2687 length:171 start_codon:yes stop_codon:yes gene_type:complete